MGNGLIVSGARQGQMFCIDSKENKKLIIDLGKEKIAAGDIEYIAEKKLLIVPTLNKNVIGYHLE